MPTIDKLASLDSISSDDQFPVYSDANDDARKASASLLTTYMAESLSGKLGADDIVYAPAGTGAVSTTVQSKLRESVSLKDFGAVGDGTDESSKVQAGLDFLRDIGGGTLNLGSLNIRCDTPLIGYTKTRVVGDPGATLDFSYKAAYTSTLDSGLFVFRGTASAEILLTVDAALNDATITVADASTLAIGDFVEVSMNAAGSFIDSSVGVKSGQLNTIVAISGNVVSLDTKIYDALAVASGARLRKVTPVENVSVQGIKFVGKGRDATLAGDVGLSIYFGKHVSVLDCVFKGVDQRSLNFVSCLHFSAERNDIYHDPKGANSTVNYGITYSSSTWGNISNNKSVNARHGIVSSHLSSALTNKYYGVSRHIDVIGNSISNTWHAGIATHNDVELVITSYNHVSNCLFGINIRDRNKTVIGNTINNCSQGIYMSSRSTKVAILNNRIASCLNALTMDSQDTGVPIVDLVIEGNIFKDCTQGGINLADDGTGLDNPGLVVCGNSFSGITGTGSAANIRITGDYIGIVSNNHIRNSTIRGIRLDYGSNLSIRDNFINKVTTCIEVGSLAQKTVVMNNTMAEYSSAISNSSTTTFISNNIDLGSGAL